jgi:dolichyl-phosphate beta-glucosyltransferase
MFLSIIIPAYNEEERISAVLQKAISFLNTKGYSFETIVVDDGSSDNTVGIVEGFSKAGGIPLLLLKNGINHGKGYAVRRGVLLSKGDYVLFSDADLSTPIEEMEKFLPFLRNGYDIVIGSRALKDSRLVVRQPWYRERMGKIFNLLVQILIMQGIKDTQCGFKIFKSEVAKKIFSFARINRFAFDVEALFIAKKFGYRIQDVPVVWINSPNSRVHILKDSFRMIADLFRIIVYNFNGRYEPQI